MLNNIFSWQEALWAQILAQPNGFPPGLLLKARQGTGEESFGHALAQFMLCESPTSKGACGNCLACGWFGSGTHPDFQRVTLAESVEGREGEGAGEGEEPESDGEKNGSKKRKAPQFITINAIRALSPLLQETAHRGKAKVVLLYPAEALNNNAANALLKSLEEPSPHTHFILICHRPRAVLPTILSRCRQLSLPAPDVPTSVAWLEQQGVVDARLALAQAGYAPLAALTLGEGNYWERRQQFLEILGRGRIALGRVGDWLKEGEEVRLLGWLEYWCYDLLCLKSTGRIRYHLDSRPILEKLSKSIGHGELTRCYRWLLREHRALQHPLNRKLLVERWLAEYSRLFQTTEIQPAA